MGHSVGDVRAASFYLRSKKTFAPAWRQWLANFGFPEALQKLIGRNHAVFAFSPFLDTVIKFSHSDQMAVCKIFSRCTILVDPTDSAAEF